MYDDMSDAFYDDFNSNEAHFGIQYLNWQCVQSRAYREKLEQTQLII